MKKGPWSLCRTWCRAGGRLLSLCSSCSSMCHVLCEYLLSLCAEAEPEKSKGEGKGLISMEPEKF